ncbi:MAG: hypothetical protein ABUK08_00395 [Candidatus Humimicrobiaceae bacterium]
MIFYVRITTDKNETYFFSVDDISIEHAEAQVNMICYYMFARHPSKVFVKDDNSGLSARTKEILSKYRVAISNETLIIRGSMLDHERYIELKYNLALDIT